MIRMLTNTARSKMSHRRLIYRRWTHLRTARPARRPYDYGLGDPQNICM